MELMAYDSSVPVTGSEEALAKVLNASLCSGTVNTSFVEGYNGSARHFNARNQRTTYSFSKKFQEYEAMSWLMATHYNFYCQSHTLRIHILISTAVGQPPNLHGLGCKVLLPLFQQGWRPLLRGHLHQSLAQGINAVLIDPNFVTIHPVTNGAIVLCCEQSHVANPIYCILPLFFSKAFRPDLQGILWQNMFNRPRVSLVITLASLLFKPPTTVKRKERIEIICKIDLKSFRSHISHAANNSGIICWTPNSRNSSIKGLHSERSFQ